MTPFMKSLIARPCYTVGPKATLSEIITLLAEHNIGAVVVENGSGKVQGIISERDIVRHLATEQDLSGWIAQDIMTKKVATVTTKALSSEMMQVMADHNCRHLPILEDGKLVGVVSNKDVMNRTLEKYQDEAEAMRAFISS